MRTSNDKAKRQAQMALLAKFISDPLGRAYMYDMLASCHIYATTFATNALAMSFREGERNMGIRLGADLTEASPDMYLQMLKEAGNVRSTTPEPESQPDTGTGFVADSTES